MEREGIRVGDPLSGRQHRQIMLFAIAEALSAHAVAAHQQLMSLRQCAPERNGHGSRGPDHKRRGIGGNRHIGHSIDELQSCHSRARTVAKIGHPHGKIGHIPLAQESRHIGLHHDLLLRHHPFVEQSVIDHPVVSQALQIPGGDTVGQGEIQRHGSQAVGHQIREEESRLIKILSHERHIAHIHGFHAGLSTRRHYLVFFYDRRCELHL